MSTELDYLRKTVSERTPGPWEFRATEHSGGIKFVVAPSAPRNKNGTEFLPADCSHGCNGHFVALLGTCADEIVKVIEAAEGFRIHGSAKNGTHAEILFKNLAALKAKIKTVMT